MKLPIYWVDAFTERVFGGNPAAVIPLDSWPEDALLQKIANENGLSETAFFIRTGPARAHLRWFTPLVEVDLCGHATLATAHVLFNDLGQSESPFVFDSKSGPLSVARRGDKIELDFPSRPGVPVEPSDTLIRGLARAPMETLRSSTMYLCVYPSEDDVRSLAPDFASLGLVDTGKVIATGPGSDCDFVSRFFAPGVGIPEDPVTGSAHCTLVPYWAARLGKKALHARQISKRGGELWCELQGERVKIAGKGVSYLRGEVTA
jgi:predicted PhzF superfamily epimerase YddE/YHI9